VTDCFWPIASSMKVGFGATQARRMLAAVEINDPNGADRPRLCENAIRMSRARRLSPISVFGPTTSHS